MLHRKLLRQVQSHSSTTSSVKHCLLAPRHSFKLKRIERFYSTKTWILKSKDSRYVVEGESTEDKKITGWAVVSKLDKESEAEANNADVIERSDFKLLHQNETKYEGFLENDEKKGFGTTYSAKTSVSAHWKSNTQPNVDYGIIATWDSSNIVFKGKLHSSPHLKEVTAFGELENKKRNYKYEGEVYINVPHGFGKMHFPTNDSYIGELHMGMMHGYGIITYQDGRKLISEFSQGRPNGVMMKVDEDGTVIYFGEVKNNAYDGYGILHYGESSFEGFWSEDAKHGFGIDEQYKPLSEEAEPKEGQTESPQLLAVYEGYYKNNQYDGQGHFKQCTARPHNENQTAEQELEELAKDSEYFEIYGTWKDNQTVGPTIEQKSNKIFLFKHTNSDTKSVLGVADVDTFKYIGEMNNYLPHGYGILVGRLKTLKGRWVEGNLKAADAKTVAQVEKVAVEAANVATEAKELKKKIEKTIDEQKQHLATKKYQLESRLKNHKARFERLLRVFDTNLEEAKSKVEALLQSQKETVNKL